VARVALRLLLFTVAISAALIGIGALYAAHGGHSYKTSIASALFIGGGAIFIVAGFTGGGVRGQRGLVFSRDAKPREMPFGWVVVGLLVIGVGVLAAVFL
jgi:hypothetical protein